jgi:DNA-binding FadR family transcriptional regulator
LAALRAKDPVAAEQAMQRHIEEPGEWVRSMTEDEQAHDPITEAGAGTKRTNA